MRFKIDWASLIVAGKFTVFALFHFVFEGNFPSTNLRGAHIWRGDVTEGFLRYRLGGVYLEGSIFGILRYANESHNCANLVFVMSSPLFSQKKLQMVDFFSGFSFATVLVASFIARILFALISPLLFFV